MARNDSHTGAARAAGLQADAELMARIAEGDSAAIAVLMERALPRVLGLARRMLGDPVEAEDVAQETFERTWRVADRWRPGEARIETWMSRIAINLCHDRLRRRRETPVASPPERADAAPRSDNVIAAGQASARVIEALSELPERQRTAIELCHFQEMGNIEAADMLDISVEALESLLARGRRKLRELLAAEAPELIGDLAAPAQSEG